MAWAQVKEAIKAIIQATAVSVAENGADAFVFIPEGAEALETTNMAPTRGFWLVAREGSRKGPTLKGPAHITMVVDVALVYKASRDQDKLDTTMVADYEALVLALSDHTLWSRSTSTIVNILGDGGYFPRQVAVGGSYRVQAITLQVEYLLT